MTPPRLLHEPAGEVPVFAEVDVLVAGGGLAGCAAALAAARAGATTLLTEREGFLGGVSTATMMASIGNHYVVADGSQTIYGIAAEVVERLVTAGAAPEGWRRLKAIPMDSERLKVALIEMLEEAGVRILTHALACRPFMEGRSVKGCFLEGKSGRIAVLAKNTVDCTGEADLAWRAGVEVREHRASSSLLFKLAGVDLERFLRFLAEDEAGFPQNVDGVANLHSLVRSWREERVFFFGHHSGPKWRWLREQIAGGAYGELRRDQYGNRPWWGLAENIDAFGMYTSRQDGTLVINTGYYCFDRIDVGELSRFETHAQRLCYYAADFMKRQIPGFEKSRLEHLGAALGLRGGRHIVGRSKLTIPAYREGGTKWKCDDVIATPPVNIHDRSGFGPATNRTAEIPFGVCVPVNASRLLVGSGKSVNTDGGNYRLFRGMSGCMVFGQATGAAAALAAQRGLPSEELPVRDLQRELLRQGVRLGDPSRLRELGLDGIGNFSDDAARPGRIER
ncbi:MAG: FAD-dependent oxidoreductase [Verrucomicrobiae bacterium]|nr:FAD-dependent oxidoreductase [Verrucomicrobiae bacterium]